MRLRVLPATRAAIASKSVAVTSTMVRTVSISDPVMCSPPGRTAIENAIAVPVAVQVKTAITTT